MAKLPKERKRNIDPRDPIFDQPRKSKKYSQMYEDFEFHTVQFPETKKGYKTVGVYKGMYYQIDLEPDELKRYRIKFSAVFLVILAVFIGLCILPYSYNSNSLVGIIEGLTAVSFAYVAVSWIVYLITDKKMTIYFYKSSSGKLKVSCSIAAIMLGISAVATLISLIRNSGDEVLASVSAIMGFILCAAGMIFLYKMEDQLPYKSWMSEDTLDDEIKKIKK